MMKMRAPLVLAGILALEGAAARAADEIPPIPPFVA